MTKQFYVDKNKPYVVPQSFVVPKAEADGEDLSAMIKINRKIILKNKFRNIFKFYIMI